MSKVDVILDLPRGLSNKVMVADYRLYLNMMVKQITPLNTMFYEVNYQIFSLNSNVLENDIELLIPSFFEEK